MSGWTVLQWGAEALSNYDADDRLFDILSTSPSCGEKSQEGSLAPFPNCISLYFGHKAAGRGEYAVRGGAPQFLWKLTIFPGTLLNVWFP